MKVWLSCMFSVVALLVVLIGPGCWGDVVYHRVMIGFVMVVDNDRMMMGRLWWGGGEMMERFG